MSEQPDALLLIGHGSPDPEGNAEFLDFAARLAGALGVSVQPCFLELAEPSIGDGLERCVAAGARTVAALPLFLGSGRHHKQDVPALLAEARARHPGLALRYGAALGPQPALARAMAERAEEAIARSRWQPPAAQTALLVVGRGSRDPASNDEVARLARLLRRGGAYGAVEVAFQAVAAPDVAGAIARCALRGARRVVVLPYLLFTGFVRHDIARQARAAQTQHPELEILVADHLFPHAGLLVAAARRYHELAGRVAAETCS